MEIHLQSRLILLLLDTVERVSQWQSGEVSVMQRKISFC